MGEHFGPDVASPAADAGTATFVEAAVAEVDQMLLDWYAELTVVERLRAATRAAVTLDRLAHAASTRR